MVSREQKRGSLQEKFQLLRSVTNSHAVIITLPSFFFYRVGDKRNHMYTYIIPLLTRTCVHTHNLNRTIYSSFYFHSITILIIPLDHFDIFYHLGIWIPLDILSSLLGISFYHLGIWISLDFLSSLLFIYLFGLSLDHFLIKHICVYVAVIANKIYGLVIVIDELKTKFLLG